MEVNLNTSMGSELRQKVEHLLDQANTKNNWASFATLNENGYPDIREMGLILREGLKAYLVSSKETCKVAQIKRNPKMCLRIFSPDYAESVNYFGTAKLIEDQGKQKVFWERAKDILAEYFSGPGDPNMVVIELNPDYLDYVSHAQKAKETKTRLIIG